MSKPLPTLPNMPWNVKQDIVDETDYETRLSLRKCSQELRGIIDSSHVDYPSLFIMILETKVTLMFCSEKLDRQDNSRSTIEYHKQSEDSVKVIYQKKGIEKVVKGQNYIQRAVSDFATFIKSPKSFVQSLVIRSSPENQCSGDKELLFACLKHTFEQLPHRTNIRILGYRFPVTQEEVLHVLPYLKPRVLTHLIVMNETREVERLVNTEQWKKAESVNLTKESNVQIQDLLHLRVFEIKDYQLVPYEMYLIIQGFLKHEKRPHYIIGLPENYDLEILRTWLNKNEALDSGRFRDSWYSKIPGTEYHFNILLRDHKLQMYRFLSAKLEKFAMSNPVEHDFPTQRITWDVTNNIVDYDTDAMCLCGNYFCHLKFGMTQPIHFSGEFSTKGFSEEQKKRDEKLAQERDNEYEEKTRVYIGKLEKESKEMEEEKLSGAPKRKRYIPWTLYSGTPFHLMSNEQLLSSYEEIEKLIEANEHVYKVQYLQAYEVRGSGERRQFSLFDMFMGLAEQTEQKIAHYKLLLTKVTDIMEACVF